MSLASIVVASIVPTDPTGIVAIVAAVALTIFTAFVTFLALAPVVSEKWTEQLHATPGGSALEAEANEAD